MKIFVTGSRGIPNIPGGIEKHCQEIYPRVAPKGHDVYVAVRRLYFQHDSRTWRGVCLVRLYAPHHRFFETIVHTFLAIIKARFNRSEILHLHAIGPGLLAPLGRLLGMRVVVTHHGTDYERDKWGKIARALLQAGERASARWANQMIVISPYIRNMIRQHYGRSTWLIPNGVTMPEKGRTKLLPPDLGLEPGKYILAVSRVEPGKGLRLLLESFSKVKTDFRLVIAGYTTYENQCSRQVKTMAERDRRVVLTESTEGHLMDLLYANASLFVLPSYHEGLPISLLEAMSYGLPVLVSDIPANLAIGLAKERYFTCGDAADLKDKLEALLGQGLGEEEAEWFRREIEEKYNWERIAEQTIRVYEKALSA